MVLHDLNAHQSAKTKEEQRPHSEELPGKVSVLAYRRGYCGKSTARMLMDVNTLTYTRKTVMEGTYFGSNSVLRKSLRICRSGTLV
ncbi:UNVERIFIED_CONTAM: hypothetical protein K2H54_035527 [Gekko kuhli]